MVKFNYTWQKICFLSFLEKHFFVSWEKADAEANRKLERHWVAFIPSETNPLYTRCLTCFVLLSVLKVICWGIDSRCAAYLLGPRCFLLKDFHAGLITSTSAVYFLLLEIVSQLCRCVFTALTQHKAVNVSSLALSPWARVTLFFKNKAEWKRKPDLRCSFCSCSIFSLSLKMLVCCSYFERLSERKHLAVKFEVV